MKYRSDIDGLRAISVLAVVLYHVGIPGITGGFIGVDVFFVISGFLITSNLLGQRGLRLRALLADFYARRARRILPSLFLVTLTTIVLGWIYLLPTGEQQDLAKSAMASAMFVSNVFFWRLGRDYFAGPMELQPFLHTWSLSVEEQFYLVWPLLLCALWAIERRFHVVSNRVVLSGIVGISALSLVLSIALANAHSAAGFFLTPSRIWELGAGAALAVILATREGRGFAGPLGLLGVLCILASATIYSVHTPFPGLAAMLPVTGATLVIAAGADAQRRGVHRLLGSAPFVVTGRLSYARYLWHWPLLAIARASDLGQRSLPRDLSLVALAYGLAYCSTRFVESPIRHGKIAPFGTPVGSLLAGAAMIAICASVPIGLWATARVHYQQIYAGLKPQTLDCVEPFLHNKLTPVAPCVLARGSAGALFLVGDSFANHWSPAIGPWAASAGVYTLERSLSSCNVLVAGMAAEKDGVRAVAVYGAECVTFAKLVLREMQTEAETTKPLGVVVSAAWPSGDGEQARELRSLLESGVKTLTGYGARVLMIEPTPVFPFSIPSCVVRRPVDACRLSRDRYDSAAEPTRALLQAIVSKYPDSRVWDPSSQFCDATWCYPMVNGQPAFSDGAHVSRPAAERAAPAIAATLSWLVAPRQTVAWAK